MGGKKPFTPLKAEQLKQEEENKKIAYSNHL